MYAQHTRRIEVTAKLLEDEEQGIGGQPEKGARDMGISGSGLSLGIQARGLHLILRNMADRPWSVSGTARLSAFRVTSCSRFVEAAHIESR